ncbi:MAG: toxin-antitoxin system HicB family antitoxin [Anaerolineae bacterium]|nr:toxin-antitoxin system HicB family antitoxin [Anaerolineae bacterium]
MGRLTLRLPETLHRQLEQQARLEGISLNQYLVYALTRQVSSAYTVTAISEHAVQEQREAYEALRQRLGSATDDQVQAVLAQREHVEPEPELDPQLMSRLRERIGRARESARES